MADNPAEFRRRIAAPSSEDRGTQDPDSDIQVTALLVLESLVRYYVQATGKIDEQQMRAMLEKTFPGEPLMDTFIDGDMAQGEQRGRATILLRLIERKFGPPSETIRHRITEADSETLLEWRIEFWRHGVWTRCCIDGSTAGRG